MRLTILALGSRGDVQPFIALGRGLVAAGHQVRLATAGDYVPLVCAYGLECAPVGGLIRDLMDWDLVYGALDAPHNPLRFARRFREAVEPLVGAIVTGCWAACRDAEALIASTLGLFAAVHIAEKQSVPLYPAHMHPYSPTRAFPHVFFPALPGWVPGRGGYNRLTHGLGEGALWQLLRAPLNRARRTVLGLPPLPARGLLHRVQGRCPPTLYAYSPTLAPRPRDWGAHLHITGYWFLDRPAGWAPPPDLAAFLAAGPPPVYIGFGSNLAGRDPDGVTALLLAALARAGQRGLLLRGWGDLGDIPLPPTVLAIDAVPHDWLFPRVAAVVHHGGAGTTAAALRAGAPAVVVPFFGDQQFWARRVHARGAGPAPIPRGALTAGRLAAALDEALRNPAFRARAAALGARLAAEQGVQRAIAALPLATGK